MRNSYDIAVLGSGVAGSSLALTLRQAGVSTLVIEHGTHPRFAIGESTVPATSNGYDFLARRYGIPEFRLITHYLGLKETGCVGFPKRHFWFGHHSEGEPLKLARELMFETLPLPIGPDVHMVRADVDAYLVGLLGPYGVDYTDSTELVEYRCDADLAYLTLKTPEGLKTVTARLVVDASGHASFFAKKFDLRDTVPRLHTDTRSVFAHFSGVGRLDAALGDRNPAFHFARDGGTQHHCFKGGWAWVIPFDNGICSVGFQLLRSIHPHDSKVSPEAEIQGLLDRYHSMKAHLGDMQPIRRIISTGRVQFTSRTIIGDRFVLTPHAAAFIEPLFSTGLVLTQSFIARFVPLAVEALRQPRIDMEVFRPIEKAFFREVAHADRIVDGTIRSFGDFEVFKQYWRTWTQGSVLELIARIGGDHARADGSILLFGAADSEFSAIVERMHQKVVEHQRESNDHGRSADSGLLAADLKATMDALSQPYRSANYAIGSPLGCNLRVSGYDDLSEALGDWMHAFRWCVRYARTHPEIARDLSLRRMCEWAGRFGFRTTALGCRRVRSAMFGTRLAGDLRRLDELTRSH